MPQRIQRRTTRQLVLAYAIALAFIAGLSTTVFTTSRYAVDNASRWGRLINDSGRQRMLVQRVALLAANVVIVAARDGDGLDDTVRALETGKSLALENFDYLKKRIEALDSDRESVAALRQLYEDPTEGVEAYFRLFLHLVDDAVVAVRQSDDGDYPLQAALSLNDEQLLPRLEETVSFFERLSMEDNKKILRIETTAYVLTLFILLLEVLFIFWPVTRSVENTIAELAEARQKAEAASDAKTWFLSMMSHEIRTPLHGIIGAVEMLHHTGTGADASHWLKALKSSSDYLMSVINGVLDLSKIESGGIEIDRHAFRLDDVTEQVTNIFRSRSRGTNVDFDVRLDAPDDSVIVSDPTRIRQILINLLGNAFKFTRQGRVDLLIELRDGAGPGTALLRITVTDTGVGIPKDKLSSIFESFTQADMSIGREFGGSGLGLSLVKSISEMLGGSVSAKSVLGIGSTFEVVIPVTVSTREQVREQTPPNSAGMGLKESGKGRVLVADDVSLNIEILEIFIRTQGWEVATVTNGRDAVDYVRARHPVDLILMDFHMPDIDGFEATRRIRALGGPQPRIVGLTADAVSNRHPMAIDSGMDEVITKPCTLQDIVAVLKETPVARPTPSARSA